MLTSFAPSEDSPDMFGLYKKNMLEKTEECKINPLDEMSYCEDTHRGTLKDLKASLEKEKIDFNNNRSYKCIGKKSTNRDECISKDPITGVIGKWALPCVKNEDCPFFRKNKNYFNLRGGCLADGYCELPLGMQHDTFREPKNSTEENSYKPLCHNCPTDAEELKDCVGFDCSRCCDLQRKPDFESPDYAFENDKHDRIPEHRVLKNKKLEVSKLNIGL